MFTSPAAQYFGYDEGYRFGQSFRVGISTNQAVANFTIALSYSGNGGSTYLPYGTINVIRPPGDVLDYTRGDFVNFNFTANQPVNTKFFLKIIALPDTLEGTVENFGDPIPRIQILLEAKVGLNGTGITLGQLNTRYSFSDATNSPTAVRA